MSFADEPITREEFARWQRSPVTRAYMATLRARIDRNIRKWLDGEQTPALQPEAKALAKAIAVDWHDLNRVHEWENPREEEEPT